VDKEIIDMAGGGRSVVRVKAGSSCFIHLPHPNEAASNLTPGILLSMEGSHANDIEYLSHLERSVADKFQARVYADVNEKLGRGWYDYGESKWPSSLFSAVYRVPARLVVAGMKWDVDAE
jgi:hypothetical protein